MNSRRQLPAVPCELHPLKTAVRLGPTRLLSGATAMALMLELSCSRVVPIRYSAPAGSGSPRRSTRGLAVGGLVCAVRVPAASSGAVSAMQKRIIDNVAPPKAGVGPAPIVAAALP